jgi:hypothetical protein
VVDRQFQFRRRRSGEQDRGIAAERITHMSKSKGDIGQRKIAEAKAHLAAQQAADRKAEKLAQKSAHKNQTTPQKIVGGLRQPLRHNTALQQDLLASPDYFPVPSSMTKVRPAVASTTDCQGQ